MNTQIVSDGSSVLRPFYDPATRVLFLAGKGEPIYFYEFYEKTLQPIYLNKFPLTQKLDYSMLPKRVCNVNQLEIARFITIANLSMEQISFSVPRKSSTLFAEDLYPPALSGKPNLQAGDWFKGKDSEPNFISLKPEGMKSIYEVPIEQGGKNRAHNLESTSLISKKGNGNPVIDFTKGYILIQTPGKRLWVTWEKRWLTTDDSAIHLFSKPEDSVSLYTIPFNRITEIVPHLQIPTGFSIHGSFSVPAYHFKLDSALERDGWLASLKDMKSKWGLMKQSSVPENIMISKTPSFSQIPQFIPNNLDINDLSNENQTTRDSHNPGISNGYLQMRKAGLFKDYWVKQFLKIENNLLFVLHEEEGNLIYTIHLDKISAVFEVHHFQPLKNTFQISTPGLVFNFQASNPEECHQWISTLEEIRKRFLKTNSKIEKV